MNENNFFGERVTSDNYLPLRSLALKLTAKEFKNTSGFGHGVHNRIRRFKTFEDYKKDEKDRAIKYGYINKPRMKKSVTVNDIWTKLSKIESTIEEIKEILNK